VYEFFASGQLTPHYTEIGFDDIPDGLDRLARGLVKGRLVARIAEAR
jgi:propanol-preferring alcohol dehydrogenase